MSSAEARPLERAGWWVAGVQILAVVMLGVLWSQPADSADASSLDLGYLVLAAATPLLLAATIGLRWWLVHPDDDAWVQRIVHALTCVLLAIAVLMLPFAVLGELLEF